MTTQDEDTATFYELLDELGSRVNGPRRLKECSRSSGWPSHGVYFFFEEGQTRPNGSSRVVRIGTHALTATSATKLWDRLSSHRGNVGGSHPGGGNHRASIFRLHVGMALLAQGDWPSEIRESWRKAKVDPLGRSQEHLLERAVSEHIGDLPFLWLDVPDRHSRGLVERNSIGLLSLRSGGVDLVSPNWLGLNADNSKVGTSGLWNVNHVDDGYDPNFLKVFASLIHNV
jgi:hypothetical protein